MGRVVTRRGEGEDRLTVHLRRWAKWLVRLSVPAPDRARVVWELEEEFRADIRPLRRPVRAVWWYAGEVASLVWWYACARWSRVRQVAATMSRAARRAPSRVIRDGLSY